MLLGETKDHSRMWRTPVAPHHLEGYSVVVHHRDGVNMLCFQSVGHALLDERNRAIKVAERPKRKRELNHHEGSHVQIEAEDVFALALGSIDRQRLFQILLRRYEIPQIGRAS